MGRILEEPTSRINTLLQEPTSRIITLLREPNFIVVGWCRGVLERQLQWLGAPESEQRKAELTTVQMAYSRG